MKLFKGRQEKTTERRSTRARPQRRELCCMRANLSKQRGSGEVPLWFWLPEKGNQHEWPGKLLISTRCTWPYIYITFQRRFPTGWRYLGQRKRRQSERRGVGRRMKNQLELRSVFLFQVQPGTHMNSMSEHRERAPEFCRVTDEGEVKTV